MNLKNKYLNNEIKLFHSTNLGSAMGFSTFYWTMNLNNEPENWINFIGSKIYGIWNFLILNEESHFHKFKQPHEILSIHRVKNLWNYGNDWEGKLFPRFFQEPRSHSINFESLAREIKSKSSGQLLAPDWLLTKKSFKRHFRSEKLDNDLKGRMCRINQK